MKYLGVIALFVSLLIELIEISKIHLHFLMILLSQTLLGKNIMILVTRKI